MIFVTVGTHEQPFDRLLKKMDELVERGVIQEEVIIQTGFSTYEPKFCTHSKLLPYNQMQENVNKARIVITHGGPASFISALQVGKIPVVVPRKTEFNEHVNDHQVAFAREVAQRRGNILVVEDIEQLEDVLVNYEQTVSRLSVGDFSNNEAFCREFRALVDKLF